MFASDFRNNRMLDLSLTSLLSGAVAGLSVDISLYPIDTIKTRVQSIEGFSKAGGFTRLYSGIGSAAFGSAPTAAAFFTAYESTRQLMQNRLKADSNATKAVIDMTAASVGEVVACIIRVPVEVVKQRAQVNAHMSSMHILRECIYKEGVAGLYRGYQSTVFREIPFSFIQFPLWQYMKEKLSERQPDGLVSPWQSAWCGFVSGGIAAGLTTPLDVVKTRIILAQKQDAAAQGRIFPVLLDILKNEGIKSAYAGIVPRVVWISIGGFIFLGMYDFSKNAINSLHKFR